MADLARGHLRKKKEELRMSLHQELSDRHRYLLRCIQNHLRWLENQREEIACQVVAAMEPYRKDSMGENVAGLSPRVAADEALAAIKKLFADVGIPSGLKQLGVKEKHLKTMAENAQKDACWFTSPRCPMLDDVILLYKCAL
jgi:hypothetical protein